MRNKQKHINVTVANQFTVHKTSYCKENFFQQKSEKGGKTPKKRCFILPTFHRYQKTREALLFNEERPIFEEQL
jgi:hypothetical protein